MNESTYKTWVIRLNFFFCGLWLLFAVSNFIELLTKSSASDRIIQVLITATVIFILNVLWTYFLLRALVKFDVLVFRIVLIVLIVLPFATLVLLARTAANTDYALDTAIMREVAMAGLWCGAALAFKQLNMLRNVSSLKDGTE